jgi:hypothetical protein
MDLKLFVGSGSVTRVSDLDPSKKLDVKMHKTIRKWMNFVIFTILRY